MLGGCDCHGDDIPYSVEILPGTFIIELLQKSDKGQIFYWSSQTALGPGGRLFVRCTTVPTSTAPYWPSTIMSQPVSPSSDPVPPSTDRYRLLLSQYHHISTSTAPYWPSTTKYQSIPIYTDPVSSYINQCRLPLIQYRQVPTSTTPYWPGTNKYQPVPTYTVVAWGLQTPAQFTLGLVSD